MEELRSYNEGLQKQCRELLEEKEKMERDIKEVEELAEGLLADSARLKAETRSQQTAIQNLEANKEELESMIGQTMNLLETSQNEHTECKADLHNAVGEGKTWEGQCKALGENLDEVSADLKESRAKAEQLDISDEQLVANDAVEEHPKAPPPPGGGGRGRKRPDLHDDRRIHE